MSETASAEGGECLVPPRRDPERLARRTFGVVPTAIRYHAHSPWLVRHVVLANHRAGGLAHLDPTLADLVFLAVSQDNSCRYCYEAQRAVLRILGFDEQRIRRVEEAASAAAEDRAEKLALDFARRLSRANPLPGAADREALRRAGFGEEAIREIACVAAQTVFANRTTMLPAIPVHEVEGLAERLPYRLLRPLAARLLRAKTRRGGPEELPEAAKRGPFAHVALPLQGDGESGGLPGRHRGRRRRSPCHPTSRTGPPCRSRCSPSR